MNGETFFLRYLVSHIALILEKDELSSPDSVPGSKNIPLVIQHAEAVLEQPRLLTSSEKDLLREFLRQFRFGTGPCINCPEGQGKYECDLISSSGWEDELINLKHMIQHDFYPEIRKMVSRKTGSKNGEQNPDLAEQPAEKGQGNKDAKSEGEGGFIDNTKPTIKKLLSKNFIKATIKHFPCCGSYLFDIIYGVDGMKEQKEKTDLSIIARDNIDGTTPKPKKEKSGWGKKVCVILFSIAAIATILVWLFGDNIWGRISKEFKSNKPTVKQIETPKIETKTIKEAETDIITPSHKIIQQTMNDSPGGTQVAGDLYINETENTRDKPIVVASATVEVKIKSDLDVNGLAANVKAYLVFVKDEKPLLITSSIGYTENQTGNDEVVYKAKLNMDANDSAAGNPTSFLKDADYILIKFGRMPSDSYVLEGDAICIINNSIRLAFSIPPQKLVNNRILIQSLSESLQVLNEPGN